jgi:hypothetical protein
VQCDMMQKTSDSALLDDFKFGWAVVFFRHTSFPFETQSEKFVTAQNSCLTTHPPHPFTLGPRTRFMEAP